MQRIHLYRSMWSNITWFKVISRLFLFDNHTCVDLYTIKVKLEFLLIFGDCIGIRADVDESPTHHMMIGRPLIGNKMTCTSTISYSLVCGHCLDASTPASASPFGRLWIEALFLLDLFGSLDHYSPFLLRSNGVGVSDLKPPTHPKWF